MPDITMCSGQNCPLKESCYRYKAKPDEYRQSYFTEPPYDREYSKCDMYWQTADSKSAENFYNKLNYKGD